MLPRPCYVLPLLVVAACDFGDDRTLGHLAASNPPGSGGTTHRTTSVEAGGTSASSGGTDAGIAERTCTHKDSSACTATQFCAFGTDCEATAIGTCRERPTECAPPSSREVVCGCDHEYYPSACEAYKVGLSLADLSACTPVACDDATDCTRFEESCTFYYGAAFPTVTCSAALYCVCESGTILN
jgi:hypothetical protein